MDEEQSDDLKQFIEATVSQSEERLHGEIGDVRQEVGDLRQELGNLRHEMREGFTGVGDALAPINDQLESHEKDIKQLKQHAA